MMRSMYSAVSGLRVHQGKMDTIGNNIANVNTVGFKKGQVSFQEVFSQVTRGASAPQGGKGGTNPQQVGMGVSVGSINTVHTPGAGQRTDNPTDLMISGEGFFAVSDDASFNNKFYTRAGNFSLDRDGNLVTADGFKVLGYMADGEGEIGTDVGGVRINKSETKAPTATNKLVMGGNLDSKTLLTKTHEADTIITDSLGNSYKITFNYTKSTDSQAGNTWDMSVNRVTDMSTGNYIDADDDPTNKANLDALFTGITVPIPLEFTSGGKLKSINGLTLDGTTTPFIESIKLDSTNLNALIFTKNKEGGNWSATDGPQSPTGTFADAGITVFDPDDPDTTKNITQYANETDLKPQAKTGNSSGVLEGFTIDATGTVVGVFSNGERKQLAQLMLAKFDNPMGLQKMGGNFFLDTRNSGEAQFGKAGTSGFGAIEGGVLEMSNVDISLEFTEMITTQRGFQANSRIITTSDEMLQELVNMKR